MVDYRYEVALSFAGEQLDYVLRVASYLLDHGVAVFYDDFERLRLVGEDLALHFDTIFGKESRCIVLFISAAYARKLWTSYEREVALRAVEGESSRLVPVVFDETVLPDVPISLGAVDARRHAPEDVGHLILAKLDKLHPPTQLIASFVAWRVTRRQQVATAFLPPRFTSGRWSIPQVPVVYAAETLCGALLEVCGFIDDSSGRGFVAVGGRISTRDPIIKLTPANLPPGWRGNNASEELRRIGSKMIVDGTVPAVGVPSTTLPRETLYVINATHPDFGSIVIFAEQPLDLRRLSMDELPSKS
jgi:RES domain-containing protein